MKVLALDFDGVISDSAVESFMVAVRTLAALDPDCAVAEMARALHASSPETIRSHPLFSGFLRLMPLGNRAEDMGVALQRLAAGDRVENQAAWDALRRESSAEFLSEFHARFYLEREALRRYDLDAWLALLPPYSRFVDLLHRHQEDCILALATAKDRASVELLLDAYSISSLFSDPCIVDKEAGLSKQAHLGLLQQRLDVAFEDMTFVDDKLNHLEDVAALGVRGVLAAWGYNGERERTLALERGFVVCELDSAEAQLFGAPGGDEVPS